MSEGRPTVTIGVPVFNAERHLRQALDSILAQTYADLEVVLSDNASTDSTEAICREYARADARIRYYRNATNIGANRNYAQVLRLARGRYFKWAAHDDVCHPTYLSRCVEVLEADPSVVLCHSKTVLVDDETRLVPDEDVARGYFVDPSGRIVYLRANDPPRRLDSPAPHRRFRDVLLATGWCFEIFGVIRTDVLRRTRAFAEPYYGVDKVILAELALLGRFVEVPEGLFFRRCHPEQSTNLSGARQAALWSDPAASRRISQRLLCLRGYWRSALEVDLNPYERALCVIALAHWPFRVDRWKAILRQRLGRPCVGAEGTREEAS